MSSSRGGIVCGPEPLVTSSTLSRGKVTFSSSSVHSGGICGSSLGGAQLVMGGGDLLSTGSRGGSVLVREACTPGVPCPLPPEGGFSSCSGDRGSRSSSVRFVSTTTCRRTKY